VKAILQLLFLFLISGLSFSQSLKDEMQGILSHIGKNIPADQLFLHLDRNFYHARDTIRFQAYIRDRRTGVFETKSSALYALLLNSDHITIDSARFRINYSTVSGWLKVPEDIPPGDYSILAFTGMDLNYSPEFVCALPVKIDNYIPGRKKTGLRGRNKDTSLYQIPPQQPAIDLRFLPEGGTFIGGFQQRIAFNAVAPSGRNQEVDGAIINQAGKTVTEFRSTPYGPGVLEFTPASGDSYFATLAEEEYNGLKWPLPLAEKTGIAMRINSAGNGLIDIILRRREPGEGMYFLTMTMNNILILSEDIRMDTLFCERIRTDSIPSGTAFITLYDSQLVPLAERLILLNDHKKMKVELSFSPPAVFPGDETELAINTTDEEGSGIASFFSVSVIDSAAGYDDRIVFPGIESAFLYDREFYNNLPFRIRSMGLESIDAKSIDVLLMTYGWRRFYPKEITPDSSQKELIDYDCLKIINPGPVKKGRSDIKLLSDEGIDIISLPISEAKEARLDFYSLDAAVSQVMIIPDADPIKNTNPVRIKYPENKDFIRLAKQFAWDQRYEDSDNSVPDKMQPVIIPDHAIMIEPVTIKGRQQLAEYEDKYKKIYQYAGTRTMYAKDFMEVGCFEDILRKYNPYKMSDQHYSLIQQEKYVYLRNIYYLGKTREDPEGNLSVESKLLPALIVLDGNPLGQSYETIADMPAAQISSVTFLRGVQGFAMYGHKAIGGIVFVTTKSGVDFNRGNNTRGGDERNDDLLKQIRLFRTDTEFYIPTKEEVSSVPEFQNRPTILWKSDVFTDGSGPVTIKFPNNLSKGTAMVFVNGISFASQIGSKRCSYHVR